MNIVTVVRAKAAPLQASPPDQNVYLGSGRFLCPPALLWRDDSIVNNCHAFRLLGTFFHLARKVIRAEAMPRVEISQAIVSAKNAPAWRGIPRFKKKTSLGGVDPYLSAANKTMMCELFPHANCHLKKMETTLSSFKYHSVCLHRGVCVCTCGCLRACMYHFLALGL